MVQLQKSTLLTLTLPLVVQGFGVLSPISPTRTSRAVSTALEAGLYFGTIGGATKRCAELIAAEAGIDKCIEIEDLKDTSDMLAHDSLIVGSPTWNTGAEKERTLTGWDQWLYTVLPKLDLKGKKVAIFGCGDEMGYSFNYCDAVGELYDEFAKTGATLTYGRVPREGYMFVNSKAEVEDKPDTVYGMLFDEDNGSDRSEAKAKQWVAQLKEEGFFD